MIQKRNSTVSIVKAIAIILMVLLHSSRVIETSFIGHFVCMFHMPLFFIMAGYCFKDISLESTKDFVLRRIKGLYWPFVKYGFIFLLFHNLFYRFHLYDDVYGHYDGSTISLYGMREFFLQSQRILRMVGNEQLLSGYWFLKSLFYGSLISFALLKYLPSENKVKKSLLGGGILVLFSILMYTFDITIPVIGLTGKDFIGATYFLFGYGYKQAHILDSHKKTFEYLICGWGIVMALLVSLIQPCSIPSMNVEKMPLYLLTSIIVSVAIIKIVNISEANLHDGVRKTIVYIGDNTLPVLTWHFISFKIVSLFIISIYGLPIQNLAYFPVIQDYSAKGYWICYLMIGIILPLILNKIFNRLKSK